VDKMEDIISENKIRNNITIKPNLWETIKSVGKIQGKSASSLIEESIVLYLEKHHINKAYMKMMSAQFVDDKENEETSASLDKLTEEDVEPGEELEL
jgi:regulator of replication initiation timing